MAENFTPTMLLSMPGFDSTMIVDGYTGVTMIEIRNKSSVIELHPCIYRSVWLLCRLLVVVALIVHSLLAIKSRRVPCTL
jgi:hypothetical protein